MAQKQTLSARMARIEEKHEELADMVKILMDAQIKTQQQFRETDARLEKINSDLDERIGKLVSAIGELISRMPPIAPKAS